jgi:signal recognition particle subunit SEC65
MSPNKANTPTGNVATSTWRRLRRAAARLQPAADRGMPLARKAGATAKRQADRTRSWAAPRAERAGQVVLDSIAPKVSSLLSATARRLEPARPRRRPRWAKLVGASAATAAATTAAAAVRSHMKASAATTPDLAEAGGTASATETAAAVEESNEQQSTGSDVSQTSEVPTA